MIQHRYVYHYTNTETLCHLLMVKKDSAFIDDSFSPLLDCSNLMFLATDISTLNDRLEYNEILKLNKKGKEYQFVQQVDKDLNGIPFVLSFSYLSNNLSMWRQYANNGSGICLKFEKSELEKIIPEDQLPYKYFVSGDCYYKKPKSLLALFDKLEDIIEGVRNGLFDFKEYETIYRMFVLQSAFLKDKSFINENEWRIVLFDNRYKFYSSPFGFCARKEITIPISALKEIQTGPLASELTKQSIKRWIELVEKETQHHIKLKNSKISFRR